MTATNESTPRPPGVPMSQWPSAFDYVLPTGPPGTITLTIDGREVQAQTGDLLIKVAQDHGTYIPRFCYHERMKPVGMCRMCLVEVEGMRGLQISCATVVADGMVVHTQSDAALLAQDGVLELLLINHPLDCPVCDRGGECPLQDTTLAFGPGESRFIEEKRHWEKPIAISDLVLLDRERCIQCGRCTRFADEIAGDALISFGARGVHDRGHHQPVRPVQLVLLGEHGADLPGRCAHRHAVPLPGPPLGPRARSRPAARPARCIAAARSNRARTASCGCSASTVSRSTTGGCATRAGSATRWCIPSRGSATRWCARTASSSSARGRRRSTPPRPGFVTRSTRTARSPSRCSVAHAAPMRTPTCGRASSRASWARTTSTRSSVTGSRPTSRSVFRKRPSPTSTPRPRSWWSASI